MMISILLLSYSSQAKTIIYPIESDDSFHLVKENFIKSTDCSREGCIKKNESKPCQYNLNDYRTYKNEVTGCAVNKNSKQSRHHGDICN